MKYQAFNQDCLTLMPTLRAESIDIICIDPPYKYLKNQKLETDFNELEFFTQAKRLLTKDGFIIMFGRGISFYRMNCILADLGFTFKEEIIWDKVNCSSPLMRISRVHETICIFSKGKGKINKSKIPYLEMKSHDIDSIISDIKRIRVILKNTKSLNAVLEFIEKNKIDYKKQDKFTKYGVTSDKRGKEDRCVSSMKMVSIGPNEKTIIRSDFELPNTERKGLTCDKKKPTGDRQCNSFQSLTLGMNEKSIMKNGRDHFSAIHPTQKPIRLLERLLKLCLPKKDKVVIADFFGGSFSCTEAVYNLSIENPEIEFESIVCELDEEYFEAGNKRIENLLL